MSNQYYMTEVDSSTHLSLKFYFVIFFICLVLGFCIFNASRIYKNNKNNVKKVEELGANVSINYDNNSNVFQLKDLTPTKDYLGKSSINKYFDFSVDIHMKQANKIKYEISIVKDSASDIDDKFIHIYLEKHSVLSDHYESVFEPASYISSNAGTLIGTPKGYMVLHEDSTNETRKDLYRLRMWVADGSTLSSGKYAVKVYLNAIAE